jgi:hypothetical protein
VEARVASKGWRWLTRWRRPSGPTLADTVEDTKRLDLPYRVPKRGTPPPRARILASTLDAGIRRPLDV